MESTETSLGADTTSNRYIIDIESGAETARLVEQDHLLTQAMGGLFPEQLDLAHVKRTLDIGCGPGTWVNNVAFAYPDIEVVGIDSNPTMISYARAMAAVQHLENAVFILMDVRKPLAFEEQSFDLVNGRFLASFLDQTCWSRLIAECKRVLTPGGILRLVECEFSSLALQRLNGALYQALRKQKRTFSVNGHSIGIAHMLGKLLHDADFEKIEQRPFLLDASLGSDLYSSSRKHAEISFLLLKPYLIGSGIVGEAEFDALHCTMMMDMLQDDFTCISFGLSAWGKTPGTTALSGQ